MNFIGPWRGLLKKRSFMASEWLKEKPPVVSHATTEEVSLTHKDLGGLPSFTPRGFAAEEELSFRPNEFLDLEWLSENLAPKSSYVLNQTLHVLSKDISEQVLSNKHFPNKIKTQLFDEFIAYASNKNINAHIESVDNFWSELHSEGSVYADHLLKFTEELTYKIALIYLLKVRFFRVLSVYDREKFLPKELLSLHSLFLRYFKRNSSREFDSSFLHSNQYSWYTPSMKCLSPINDFFENCDELSYVDILATFNGYVSGVSLKSHAVSHKNTGLFLNCLILNFFQWLERNKVKYDFYNADNPALKVVSCRFSGDYVIDHSCAHWLAQHNNSYFKWNELICPEFESEDRYKSVLVNYINEIEYYTFLVKISSFYSESPLEFISKCSKEFNSNRREDIQLQKNFILEGMNDNSLTYDRLVVSQLNTPRKNAHHALITKIQDHIPFLKENGYMVILSSTNLFVHSQKSRVQSLLKKLSLESVIQLQDVCSRGELPPYIYLFSKKPKVINRGESKISKKETCYNFRLTGKLDCHKDFALITDELNKFFENHLIETPSFFSKDFGKDYQLEFFQDAIIDGKFIHSASDDSGQITHPRFFKQMLQNCMPLSYFFEIHTVDVEKLLHGNDFSSNQLDFSSDFESINQFGSDQLVLVVNFSDINNAKLELCSFDLLSGKVFQYGMSSCYYYRVVPKSRTMNSNIFREYFKSEIGKQLTQMSVSGSYHQVKSKISTLLVPKMLAIHTELPAHLKDCFDFLLVNEDKLQEINLDEMKHKISDSRTLISSLAEKYPYDLIAYLTNFKSVVSNLAYSNGGKNIKNFDFNSEDLRSQLVNCDLVPFYPNNKDLFLEFHGEHRELPRTLSKSIMREEIDGCIIDFFSEEKLILSVHCSQSLGAFLSYLLGQMTGYPIIDILKNLKIPRDAMITDIIKNHKDKSSALNDLYSISDQLLNEIFRNSLVSKKS